MLRRAAHSESESDASGPPRPKKAVPKKRGRPSKKRQASDDDDDEDAEDVGATQRGKGKKAPASRLSDADAHKKAFDLVRYALANELTRKPMKRDDAAKRVLGAQHTRAFPAVLKIAQEMLAKTFGLELVALRAKGDGLGSKAIGAARGKGIDDDSDDDVPATVGGVSKTKKAPTTKQYILRSVLNEEWLAKAADPSLAEDDGAGESTANARRRPLELADEREGAGLGKTMEVEEDVLTAWRADDKALFDWKRSDQVQHTGILFIVLGLILVNQRRCADDQLRVYLKRVHLKGGQLIPCNPSMTLNTAAKLTLDKYLVQLVQQGYLERVSNKNLAGQHRDGDLGTTGDPTVDWLWGPRADAEVGEEAVAEFMAEFATPKEARTAQQKTEVRGKRRVEIAKAAGSVLLEAREGT